MSRLSRDVALNLAGLAFPVAIALVAVPFLLKGAGVERLGFLTIAWAAIGYLGFLDFGLSRAIARRVAAALDDASLAAEVALMFRFGRILFWSGLAVAAAVFALIPARWIFGGGSAGLPASELNAAWAVLLFTLPAILASNVWRGAMEGRRAFGPVNLYRVLLGIWTYGAPIIVLVWTHSIEWLVAAISLGRWLSAWLHYRWCRRELPVAADVQPERRGQLIETLKEGAWMTVSNVVGPILVLMDRFVISSVSGLAAAAVYSIPQEIALRMLLLPAAVAISVFPRFAAGLDRNSEASALALPERASRLTLGMMVPASFVTIAIAPVLLEVWLGAEIARSGAFVLQVFALSVLLNAPANIAFILLQARGHARWSAVLHLVELPVTVALLVWAVKSYGIDGAAWVWFARIVVDTAAMFLLARRIDPDVLSRRFVLGSLVATGSALLLIAIAQTVQGFAVTALVCALLMAVSLAAIFNRREFVSLKDLLATVVLRR
jgi:O-antigen/teichoic acid export membrane protein